MPDGGRVIEHQGIPMVRITDRGEPGCYKWEEADSGDTGDVFLIPVSTWGYYRGLIRKAESMVDEIREGAVPE